MIFNEDDVVKELNQLSQQHKVVFAASCCERLFPNYVVFSKKVDWGNVTLLRKALDFIWDSISNLDYDKSIVDKYIRMVGNITPDADDFSDPLVSAALDASCAISLSLQCLQSGSTNYAADVASLAVDTVDMYLRELLELEFGQLEPADLDYKVLTHPFMIREMENQKMDLTFLQNLTLLDPDTIQRIQTRSFNNGVSNIGLTV